VIARSSALYFVIGEIFGLKMNKNPQAVRSPVREPNIAEAEDRFPLVNSGEARSRIRLESTLHEMFSSKYRVTRMRPIGAYRFLRLAYFTAIRGAAGGILLGDELWEDSMASR
jgi:hypothetical protein